MAIGYELSLKQVQKLIMTPELRQAITILQLPADELEQYIQEQLLENPVLELTEPEMESASEETGTETDRPAGTEEGAGKLDRDRNPEIDWQEYFHDEAIFPCPGNPRCGDDEDRSYEGSGAVLESLADHLLSQLRIAASSPLDLAIGEAIIGSLDEDGYLTAEFQEIAKLVGCAEDDVRRIVKLFHSFDPPGVAARGLRECLLIQLAAQELDARNRELVGRLIRDHLDDIAGGRMQKVASNLGITPREVQGLLEIVKRLDPKPARQFGGDPYPRTIIPDVTVRRIDGGYVILVNDVVGPRLSINPFYRNILNETATADPSGADFIKTKLNSAMWLIKSLEQRRMTLYRVSECIVNYQRDFFERGVKFLKPLTLKEVAETVGVHESTVSRACAGKYIETPRGTFEFKFFFTSGLPTIGGKVASSEAIKKMIREFIESEDAADPYSDEDLRRLLAQRGIMIARRTCAKYREELMIPPSSRRRRY